MPTTTVWLQKATTRQTNRLSKVPMKTLIFLVMAVLSTTSVYAQQSYCLTPGAPGCTRDDFDRALAAQGQSLRQQQYFQQQQDYQQQQQYFQQQQLQEMRRNNEILEQQLQQQRFNNMWVK
jgi:hypothetical protein